MMHLGIKIALTSGGGASAPSIALSGASVAENSIVGTAVGTASVVGEATGTPLWSLADSALGKFAIDAGTGAVTVAGAIDREAGATQNIVVAVAGMTPAIANQAFVIAITDVNEFAPVITSHGGGATAAINFAENSTGVVGQVVATDADATATITYSISGGADAAKFAIDPATGEVTPVAALNFEVPSDADANGVYDIIVQASDGTNTDTQTWNITITDVAEGSAPDAPTIDIAAASDTGSSSTDDISSDTTPTLTVTGTFQANDQFTLHIDAVPQTPHVVTAGEAAGDPWDLQLDALAPGATYALKATNTRGGLTSASSNTINYTLDTTAPSWTSSATANNAENTVLAQTLAATGAESYAIRTAAQDAASVDHDKFEISGTTLRWTSNGTKDFEAPDDTGLNNTYVVVVRATDTAGNFADQTHTITVTDVAEGVSNDWLLEDASGSWQLEDASGNWILEAA